MGNLLLHEAVKESQFHCVGLIELKEVARIFKEYKFLEDELEKAQIHKQNILTNENNQHRISPYILTLRVDMEEDIEINEQGTGEITYNNCEIRDGRSKTCAIVQLGEEWLSDNYAVAHIFNVSREKMDKLEKNEM